MAVIAIRPAWRQENAGLRRKLAQAIVDFRSRYDQAGARGLFYSLPTISTFFGIVIQMFWRDHGPPHFHAIYAEHEAVIDIRELRVLRGSLPRRALALVLEWAAE